MNRFLRTSLLLSEAKMKSLANSHIMVFGVGGVGGYVVEALVRSGVSKITIIDNDTVNITNLNRQIIALESTLDMLKVDVVKERILAINPNCEVNVYPLFITEENIDEINFDGINYIVDAVDMLTHKDKNDDYFDYVRGVAKNPLAKKVKIADLTTNSDLSRLDNPTKIDFERAEKYKKALQILQEKN